MATILVTGGCGLIITEITRVTEGHGIGEYDQLSLSKDENIESFSKLADAIHQFDSRIFVQLQHPGRETYLALTGTDALVSSSPIPSVAFPQPTRALTIEEIRELISQFGDAALRAKKAGIGEAKQAGKRIADATHAAFQVAYNL